MAKFLVTGPDGAKYEVEAPDDATEQQLVDYVQKNAAKPEVSQLESAGRGALQGVTFGFGDEIYGAAAGAYDKLLGSGDFSGTYERERDAVRAANDRAQEANPGTYLAGELAGGFAVPLGAAKAGYTGIKAARAGLGSKAAAAGKEGAMYGAAYGFGNAEGSPIDQVISTAGGAAGGALFGAALPPAIAAGQAIVRAPMQAARVATQPRQVAAEKMVEAFGRDAGQEVLGGNPLAAAAGRLAADQQATGAPLMLADMGGENVKNLMRSAVNMPNARAERFNQVLQRRKSLEGRRLSDKIEETLAGGTDYTKTLDDLVEARSHEASGTYQRAYSMPWKVKPNSELIPFLQRGYMQRLMDKTKQSIEGMSGEDLSAITPWQFLHRVKMEINREIGRMKRGQQDSAANWTMADLTKLNREFGNIISKENPSLSYALSKYSDKSAMINAVEDGLEDAFKLSAEELSKKISSLTPRDREFYRIGHARAHIEKLRGGDVYRDKSKSLYNSDDMGLRLKAVFPEGTNNRGAFIKAINAEKRMNATRAAAQGNSTTVKQATNAQEAGKAARTSADVISALAGSKDAILRTLERGANYASGITPGVAAELLNLGMAQGGNRLNAMTSRAIQEAFARGQARNAMRDRLANRSLPPGVILSQQAFDR